MKKVKLFLAATEQALAEDRMAIADLISTLNDKYEDKDLYFQLIKPKTPPTQKDLADCEMAFVIWFHQSDEITDASFESALKEFQLSGKPKIVTYFRQSVDEDIADNVSCFMERLDKELGHYYNLYSHIDSLRFTLLMQISALEQDISLECKNGKVLIDGYTYMSLYDVPCGANNKSLQALQDELRAVTAKFYELRELHADHEDDKKITEEYMAVAERRNDLREQIAQMEKNILTAALSMAQNVADGSLSDRQKEAYRLFEKGDYEGANAILDFSEIKCDIENAERVVELAGAKLQTHVNELLQKIDILKAGNMTSDAYAAIEACYNEAVRVEEAHQLPKSAMYQRFLWFQEHHNYEEAISICERLLLHWQLEQCPDGLRQMDTQYKLAELYYSVNNLEAAEKLLQPVLDSPLVQEKQSSTLLFLAQILISKIHLDCPGKEAEALTQIVELEEYFNSADYNEQTFFVYHQFILSVGSICKLIGWFKYALVFAKAEQKLLNLVEYIISDDQKPVHATCYVENQLLQSEMLFDMGDLNGAKIILEQTRDITQSLLEEDVIRFAPLMAKACTLTARYYRLIRDFDEAYSYLDEANDYMEVLYKRSPASYGANYAILQIQLAEVLQGLGWELDLNSLEKAVAIGQAAFSKVKVIKSNSSHMEVNFPAICTLLSRQQYIITHQNVEQFNKEYKLAYEYWDKIFVNIEEQFGRNMYYCLYMLSQILHFCIYQMAYEPFEDSDTGKYLSEANLFFDLKSSENGSDWSGLLNSYCLTYYRAFAMYYMRIDRPKKAKEAAELGLQLLSRQTKNGIEQHQCLDYALLHEQLALAALALEDTQTALTSYEEACDAMKHLNEKTNWANWPDVHLLMCYYFELSTIAMDGFDYDKAAGYLDSATKTIFQILSSEDGKGKEDAYCLLTCDYAKCLSQLSNILKMKTALEWLDNGINWLEARCQESESLGAIHKSLLLLYLQKAYIYATELAHDEASPKVDDITTKCEEHVKATFITDKDYEEWWEFYNRELKERKLSFFTYE